MRSVEQFDSAEPDVSYALLASEALFHACVENSPAGLFLCDASGAYIYTNERWQKTYGLTFAQALGGGWTKALNPDEASGVYQEWQQAVAIGREYDCEHRILRKDDTVTFVRARARAIRDSAGGIEGFVGSVADITDRCHAQRALFAERRRLAHVIEGTQAGTWEWNIQTGEMRFNRQWARIVGHTLEELCPVSMQTWLERAHPRDRVRSNRILERHFAGACPAYECEVRLRHREGNWIWVLSRGRVQTWTEDRRPEWMFGVDVDITALKNQADALRRTQNFLDRTGQVAGVGGWEFDLVCGEIVWSDETCRIHAVAPGYRPALEEVIRFYTPEAQPIIRAAFERGMAEGLGWDLELPLLRANGQRIWVRAVGTVELENGRPARLVGACQDITDARQLRVDFGMQHELLRMTLQSVGDAVITTNSQGEIAWLNPVAERLTGWANQEAKGLALQQVFQLVDEESREPVATALADGVERGSVACRIDHGLLISRHGAEFAIEDSVSPIRSDEGETLGAVVVFRDVTEQRRLSGENRYRAIHDALTGLVNRVEFENRLREMLQMAREEHSEHALLYIDIDRFRLVNSACGHSIGDELLQQVARLLAEATREQDTLARIGGDEFAIILDECSAAQAKQVGERICDDLDTFRFVHDGRNFRIGASIGLVTVDSHWPTIAPIMQAADSSCYAAKAGGRNRVHVWLDSDTGICKRGREAQWAMRIEQALDHDRFVLYAQRIEALGAGTSGICAEALIRMVEENGTVVLPGEFLSAAERFHLASRIDRWTLQKAITWLKVLPDLRIMQKLAVNVSGQSVGDRAFHRFAFEVLSEAGPQICERICLEITETAAVTHMADAALFIAHVRALGVRVALDDFGAGASSFGYLKKLAVDFIKIDGQFIRDLVDDPLDQAAVRCFVEVANVLGVKTVAEFVDQPRVLAKLRQMGIDYAQGFLLHRPEPIDGLLGIRSVASVRHLVEE